MKLTPEEVLAMAELAGIDPYDLCCDHRIGEHYIQHFAAMVAEREREECARVAENLFQTQRPYAIYAEAAQECADAIRARSKTE